MNPSSPDFCKHEACPSSAELLEYENDHLSQARESEITRHLGRCEFCEAEVEFYSNYPQAEDSVSEVTVIPAPLFELAEALLGNRQRDASSLNALIKERENLVADAV
jgi:hypothetical protein